MGETNRQRQHRRAREGLAKKIAARPPVIIDVPIPAVCDHCHRAFNFKNLIGTAPGNQITVVFNDVKVGPCPHCGCQGTVPDGIYTFKTLAQSLVETATTDERTALSNALSVLPTSIDSDQLADAIQAAGSHWKQLADFIRPTSGAEIAGYLALLLSVLFYFVPR